MLKQTQKGQWSENSLRKKWATQYVYCKTFLIFIYNYSSQFLFKSSSMMCCKWVSRKLAILKKNWKKQVPIFTTRSELKIYQEIVPAYPSTNILYVLNQFQEFQETNIGMNQCFQEKKQKTLQELSPLRFGSSPDPTHHGSIHGIYKGDNRLQICHGKV